MDVPPHVLSLYLSRFPGCSMFDHDADPSRLSEHGPVPLKQPKKQLMTEEEACDFLRVSREAIFKFRRDQVDPIPCFKAGRRYLYDPSEVLRWAKRQAERVLKKYRRLR